MGLLDKLFGRSQSQDEKAQDETPLSEACTHGALAPRWDDPEDMGKEDRATSWYCQSCDTAFTPAEAADIRAAHAV